MNYRDEKMTTDRPRLLLAYVDSAHAAQTARYFRRHGWEVHLAANAAETQRLVQELEPRVVIIDTELPGESGWLTCAKLTMQYPALQAYLLAPYQEIYHQARACTVGAMGVIVRSEGVSTLAREIMGEQLAHAV